MLYSGKGEHKYNFELLFVKILSFTQHKITQRRTFYTRSVSNILKTEEALFFCRNVGVRFLSKRLPELWELHHPQHLLTVFGIHVEQKKELYKPV